MGKLLASHINVSGNIYCIDIKKKTSLKKKTGNHSSKISSYLPESLSLPLKSSRLFDAKKNVGSLQAIQTLKKSLEGTHPNRLQALKIPQKKSRWFSGRCLLHLFLKDFHNAARHFLWEKKQIMDSFFCKRDEMREATKTMVSHTGNWEGTQMVRKKKNTFRFLLVFSTPCEKNVGWIVCGLRFLRLGARRSPVSKTSWSELVRMAGEKLQQHQQWWAGWFC